MASIGLWKYSWKACSPFSNGEKFIKDDKANHQWLNYMFILANYQWLNQAFVSRSMNICNKIVNNIIIWSLPQWQKFIFSLKCLSDWENNIHFIREKRRGIAGSKYLGIFWVNDTILGLYLILHWNLWHYFSLRWKYLCLIRYSSHDLVNFYSLVYVTRKG